MKPIRKSLIWASTTLVMMLGVAAPPNLQAQEGENFECSNETLKGAYGFSGTGTNKQGDFHGTSTGVLVFDGMGQTTVFKFTQAHDASPDPESPGGFETVVFDVIPGLRGEYTVNPDCTGTSKLLAPDGTEIASSAFVLVNGGREGWGIDTTGPVVSLTTFKRIDPVDEQHEAKVDTLADDLANTRVLVRRIALALGVLRRGE